MRPSEAAALSSHTPLPNQGVKEAPWHAGLREIHAYTCHCEGSWGTMAELSYADIVVFVPTCASGLEPQFESNSNIIWDSNPDLNAPNRIQNGRFSIEIQNRISRTEWIESRTE